MTELFGLDCYSLSDVIYRRGAARNPAPSDPPK